MFVFNLCQHVFSAPHTAFLKLWSQNSHYFSTNLTEHEVWKPKRIGEFYLAFTSFKIGRQKIIVGLVEFRVLKKKKKILKEWLTPIMTLVQMIWEATAI